MATDRLTNEIDGIPHHARPALVFPGLRGLYERMDGLSYLVMRVGFGLIMFSHGYPKLLGLPHGTMANPMAGTVTLIESVLHLPGAATFAYLVAVLETFGGLFLAAGLLTRVLAPVFAVHLAIIAYVMGTKFGFPWADKGAEYPVMWGLTALYIAFHGGGRFSLDWKIGREM
ncbi:MAG: DoxX family protein [Pseudomonadota bacterium]